MERFAASEVAASTPSSVTALRDSKICMRYMRYMLDVSRLESVGSFAFLLDEALPSRTWDAGSNDTLMVWHGTQGHGSWVVESGTVFQRGKGFRV